jgi:antitoxin (DNA-binding transcriptional repressor) of toxin-antitoxin stability system
VVFASARTVTVFDVPGVVPEATGAAKSAVVDAWNWYDVAPATAVQLSVDVSVPTPLTAPVVVLVGVAVVVVVGGAAVVVGAGAVVVTGAGVVVVVGAGVVVVVAPSGRAVAAVVVVTRGRSSTPPSAANLAVEDPSRPVQTQAVVLAVVVPRVPARAVAVPGPLLAQDASATPPPASRTRTAASTTGPRRLTACSRR